MDKCFYRVRHSFLHAVFKVTRGLAVTLLLVFLGHLLAAAPVAAETETTVRIDPERSTLPIGATTVVDVRIENVNDLAGAEVHLTYDSSLVEVQQIQAGGFPSADFVAQSKFGDGKIDYAIAQMPKQHSPVSGSGIMLKITLKGKTDGASPMDFKGVILANPAGQAIPVGSQNGQIAVGTGVQPTATPNGNDLLQPVRSFIAWLLNLIGFH